MVKEQYFPSCGRGEIHVCRWEPEGEVKGVVQILHGIAEYALRYDAFARFLNKAGFLVVAEDHMGHGGSFPRGGTKGYFHGGWSAAVKDSYELYTMTRSQFPDLPYYFFGHSMGSFMLRTILIEYPQCQLDGCIICGTGWIPQPVLQAGKAAAKLICRLYGEDKPNQLLQSIVFSGYNKKVEHPRTPYDWLSRDPKIVDAYVADPLCGFTVSAGLLRDMLGGIAYIQQEENLAKMNKALPVHFIAGGDDPVGQYGQGVHKTQEAFASSGMRNTSIRIYPLCRHEILNEQNRQEIFNDVRSWLSKNS